MATPTNTALEYAREAYWNTSQRNRIQANDPDGTATDLEVDAYDQLRTTAEVSAAPSLENKIDELLSLQRRQLLMFAQVFKVGIPDDPGAV